MKQDKSKIKYFLYARKSSESEERQIQSIDDQINRLKELASNFNLTIKNAGIINAKNVSLSILDEDKVIEERDLGDINYGAGISLQMSGLKLARKNPDEITFVINKNNMIKEIDNKNNIIKIKL